MHTSGMLAMCLLLWFWLIVKARWQLHHDSKFLCKRSAHAANGGIVHCAHIMFLLAVQSRVFLFCVKLAVRCNSENMTCVI